MHYPEADNAALELRAQLHDVFSLEHLERDFDGRSWVFTGCLTGDPETTYEVVGERFGRLGFLPLFRHGGSQDVIIATPALPAAGRPRLIVNVALLVATLFTTLLVGAPSAFELPGSLLREPALLLQGAPFAFALLGILGTHELGHYMAARLHGIQVTLPYFIPLPLSPLGTLGAFILMRSPVITRRQLFDVGIAGPLAGLAVAIPVTILGLATSPVVEGWPEAGRPVLFGFLQSMVHGPLLPGQVVLINPVAWAGLFGLWITAINLIPTGQLDGGHIGYAVFGRMHRTVAWAAFGLLLLAGFASSGLWLMAFLIVLIGIEHPPTLNDLSALDPLRRLAGLAAFALGVLLFSGPPF